MQSGRLSAETERSQVALHGPRQWSAVPLSMTIKARESALVLGAKLQEAPNERGIRHGEGEAKSRPPVRHTGVVDEPDRIFLAELRAEEGFSFIQLAASGHPKEVPMDDSKAPSRQANRSAPAVPAPQGGTGQPADRAPVALRTAQTPEAAPAERYELRDPFAELTYPPLPKKRPNGEAGRLRPGFQA